MKNKTDFIEALKTTNIVAIDCAEQFYEGVFSLAEKHTIGRVFQDFLETTVCTFHQSRFRFNESDCENEALYWERAKPYSSQELAMLGEISGFWFRYCREVPFNDFLGIFYMHFVCTGEHGQVFTPKEIVDYMVTESMLLSIKTFGEGKTLKVLDPSCGSGRFLVRAGRDRPHDFYCGQDIDRKCALMTVLNLFVNGLKGEVLWGDTLIPDLDRTWDCWQINTHGIGIYRVPVENSYIFQTNQHKRAEKQAKSQKPKINVGTINLPSENRAKEQGKAVQGGMF